MRVAQIKSLKVSSSQKRGLQSWSCTSITHVTGWNIIRVSVFQCLSFENSWWVKKSSPKITERSDFSLSISVHYLPKTILFSHHLNWTIFFFLNPTKTKAFLKFWLEVNNKVLEQPVTKAVRYLKQIWQTQSCLLFDVLDEAALYGKFFNSEKMNRKWNMYFLFFDEVSDFS